MRIDAALHVMDPLGPSGVRNHLKLRVEVIPYRGHATELGPTRHIELWRATLERERRLTRVWYSELAFAPADVCRPVRHDTRVLPGEPEYAVYNEIRRDDRRRGERTAGNPPTPLTPDVERIEFISAVGWGKHTPDEFTARQITESRVHIELVARRPGDLRVDLVVRGLVGVRRVEVAGVTGQSG